MLGLKTILHPTDFSDASIHALDVAGGLAADYGASLVILHVVTTPILTAAAEMAFECCHAIDVVPHMDDGNPADEILHMAQVCNADLIVMGSHGRDRASRWFMGSVAQAVMRKANCPVLTLTTQSGPPHLSAGFGSASRKAV